MGELERKEEEEEMGERSGKSKNWAPLGIFIRQREEEKAGVKIEVAQ